MLIINEAPAGFRTLKMNWNRKHALKDCTSSSDNLFDGSSRGRGEGSPFSCLQWPLCIWDLQICMQNILTDFWGGQATILVHRKHPPLQILQITIIIYRRKVPRNSSDGPGPVMLGTAPTQNKYTVLA